jgi:hypothetical protein
MFKIFPILLISTEKSNKHAGIQPTQWHFPDPIAMESLELCGAIRRNIMLLQEIQIFTLNINTWQA